MTLTEVLILIEPILLLAGLVGGYLSLRTSFAKSQSEVAEQLRKDLTAENELLTARVNRLEKENRRLEKVMRIIAVLLKETLGIRLEIGERIITLRSRSGTSHHVAIDDDEKEIS
jgi:cell division protein FtsB